MPQWYGRATAALGRGAFHRVPYSHHFGLCSLILNGPLLYFTLHFTLWYLTSQLFYFVYIYFNPLIWFSVAWEISSNLLSRGLHMPWCQGIFVNLNPLATKRGLNVSPNLKFVQSPRVPLKWGWNWGEWKWANQLEAVEVDPWVWIACDVHNW